MIVINSIIFHAFDPLWVGGVDTIVSAEGFVLMAVVGIHWTDRWRPLGRIKVVLILLSQGLPLAAFCPLGADAYEAGTVHYEPDGEGTVPDDQDQHPDGVLPEFLRCGPSNWLS